MSQPTPPGASDPYGSPQGVGPTQIGPPSAYAAGPYGQPEYGQSPYGQGYDPAAYPQTPGHPPYGQPPPYPGWTDPGMPAGTGGPPQPPRKRWPLVVGIVAALAVVGGGIAVAVPLLGDDPLPPPVSTPAAAPPTGGPPSSSAPASPAPATVPQPPSAAGGDPAADRALWESIGGSGVTWESCRFSDPVVPQATSQLDCATVDPVLDRGVSFESYPTRGDLDAEVGRVQGLLTGEAAADCSSGGTYRGVFLRWELVCGYVTEADGSNAYVISWRDQDKLLLGTLVDPDPATAWQWWLDHTPF
ncbi:MAG TPA: hypothetical protein VM367_17520 [Pseudonocardia sp.]|nr:hypothetical protein [Pseudonocardia sp.]